MDSYMEGAIYMCFKLSSTREEFISNLISVLGLSEHETETAPIIRLYVNYYENKN